MFAQCEAVVAFVLQHCCLQAAAAVMAWHWMPHSMGYCGRTIILRQLHSTHHLMNTTSLTLVQVSVPHGGGAHARKVEENIRSVEEEVALLQQFDHPNIVRYLVRALCWGRWVHRQHLVCVGVCGVWEFRQGQE